MVEVQVKAARGDAWPRISWPLGTKSQSAIQHEREYFVLVAVPHDLTVAPRCFVLPRSHVAAAAWISHMDWLTEPGTAPGRRNAPVERARLRLPIVERYENRWDLLFTDDADAPVLLPSRYRALAEEERVGLPPGHTWRSRLPQW